MTTTHTPRPRPAGAGGYRRGVWHTTLGLKALDHQCPYCQASAGVPCQGRFHEFRTPHVNRTSQVGKTYTTTPPHPRPARRTDRMTDRPKLYIAGPMTGLPDYNYPAFNRAQFILEGAGYEVINPTTIGQHDGWTHDDYLRAALALMLQADAVALLPGWEKSKGASIEVAVSKQLPFHVARKTVDEWVGSALRADYYAALDTPKGGLTMTNYVCHQRVTGYGSDLREAIQDLHAKLSQMDPPHTSHKLTHEVDVARVQRHPGLYQYVTAASVVVPVSYQIPDTKEKEA